MNEKINFLNENNSENIPTNKYVISQLETPNIKDIEEIILLDNQIFPAEMWVEASELKKTIESGGVQTILKDENEKIVGYIISSPYEQVYSNLKEFDDNLTRETGVLYIGSMGISPKHRNLKNFLSLWKNFVSQSKQAGYTKINGHFRSSQGLSSIIEKRFGGKKVHRIENWAGFGEPFDYIEINISNDEKNNTNNT